MHDERKRFTRPIIIAIVAATTAEIGLFTVYGLILFPDGPMFVKLAWTLTCGLAIGSIVGALTNLIVTGRMDGVSAAICTGVIAVAIPLYCIGLCYFIDRRLGYFGTSDNAAAFVAGGIILTAVFGLLYPWSLYSRRGHELLVRIGI